MTENSNVHLNIQSRQFNTLKSLLILAKIRNFAFGAVLSLGLLCLGAFVFGAFVSWRFCLWGFYPWSFCPWGFCTWGFRPRPSVGESRSPEPWRRLFSKTRHGGFHLVLNQSEKCNYSSNLI